MATSRTGTATWKRVRAYALKEAKANGQTKCPFCKVTLNYDLGLTPSSAEADHIIAHANGGQDRADAVQILCRRCNQSKGAGDAPKPRQVHSVPFINPRW